MQSGINHQVGPPHCPTKCPTKTDALRRWGQVGRVFSDHTLVRARTCAHGELWLKIRPTRPTYAVSRLEGEKGGAVGPMNDDDRDWYEERAAIMEYVWDMPRADAEREAMVRLGVRKLRQALTAQGEVE